MRKIKLSLGLLMLCLFTFAFSSCFGYGNVNKTKTSGYFRYQVDKETNEAILVGLTEEGEQQETIIIPSQIDGHKLTTIGYPVTVPPGKTIQYKIDIKSDNLKELYIPSCIYKHEIGFGQIFDSLPNLSKIFWGGESFSEIIDFYYKTYDIKAFVSKNHSIVNKEKYENSYSSNGKIDYSYLTIANVVYYLNDDTEDSYFVDDCDNEKIVNIPIDPVRDGYEFKGWYKEKECINKWDFENDIVPIKQYDENNEYIFIETSLYAKWEENYSEKN